MLYSEHNTFLDIQIHLVLGLIILYIIIDLVTANATVEPGVLGLVSGSDSVIR